MSGEAARTETCACVASGCLEQLNDAETIVCAMFRERSSIDAGARSETIACVAFGGLGTPNGSLS